MIAKEWWKYRMYAICQYYGAIYRAKSVSVPFQAACLLKHVIEYCFFFFSFLVQRSETLYI
jgi:hypothetical protein